MNQGKSRRGSLSLDGSDISDMLRSIVAKILISSDDERFAQSQETSPFRCRAPALSAASAKSAAPPRVPAPRSGRRVRDPS
jgi:hypothetical protein